MLIDRLFVCIVCLSICLQASILNVLIDSQITQCITAAGEMFEMSLLLIITHISLQISITNLQDATCQCIACIG